MQALAITIAFDILVQNNAQLIIIRHLKIHRFCVILLLFRWTMVTIHSFTYSLSLYTYFNVICMYDRSVTVVLLLFLFFSSSSFSHQYNCSILISHAICSLFFVKFFYACVRVLFIKRSHWRRNLFKFLGTMVEI